MRAILLSDSALEQIMNRYESFTGYKPLTIQIHYFCANGEIIITMNHRDGHVRFGYNGHIVWDIYGRAAQAFSGNPGILTFALESARQIA
jgi:hypothetical protein